MNNRWADRIRADEVAQGFTLVDEAPWLVKEDWTEIVASLDGPRVRLVLLDARYPGQGAFTRLIARIAGCNRGLSPVVVEPAGQLKSWCIKHQWKRRRVGVGIWVHEIWYPRK
jgi:hypothetical protein